MLSILNALFDAFKPFLRSKYSELRFISVSVCRKYGASELL